MTVLEILTRLYAYSRKVNRVPRVREKGVASLFKEVHRKIGSSRKALYIVGIISNARRKIYPRLSFVLKDGRYYPDEKSLDRFKEICRSDPTNKERVM